MPSTRPLAFALLAAVASFHAVRADDSKSTPAPAAPAELEFFEKKIRPLLIQKCGECHSKGSGDKSGELYLDTGTGITKGGTRGKAVVPSKPDESLLLKAVRYADENLQMPPEGKLPEAEIALLTEWVRRGAAVPNDAPAGGAAKTAGPVVDKSFWSFQPLRRVDPPTVKNDAWPRGRIDRFLLARIEAAGLSPAPEADRRTLLRRVSFDLTGLPPSADEVDAFLSDDRPDAYERAVDRLLLSPHYGERAARAWLDLARYTDTVASWLKGTENAWLYRDWVVRAMNEDRPWNEFVRLQLAADQIPETPVEDLAALGFLGLSPTYWKELRLSPSVILTVVAEEWDERIDAVSRTFLGLTVACARCHHHKFDPVTMEDYYGLAGVFASSQLVDRPLLPAPQADAVRKARDQVSQWDAELKKIKDMKSEPATALLAKIEELKKATPAYDKPWAHVVEDAAVHVLPNGDDATKVDVRRGEVRDVPMFRRGSVTNPGEVVPRRFLALFSAGEPKRFERGSGRVDLADALLNDARPLVARVLINRVWARLFGQGLVRTVSDFGSQGERPTHPELLDDLSRRFVEGGWSLRALHRELVTSAAYRQASIGGAAADPDNRLLARMPRRRLDIEAWRDAILVATGRLDPALGGPSAALDAPTNRRRTLYGTVGRHEQNEMLKLYDFPEPSTHSPSRVPTTTPLQQLFVLNSPFLEQSAESLAALTRATLAASPTAGDSPTSPAPSQSTESNKPSASNSPARIAALYRRTLQRQPMRQEAALGERFLQDATSNGLSDDEAWKLFAHAILSLNEMMFVD